MQRYSLVKLPVELLLLIGGQVRHTQNFKKLRLVCKLFDDIFAPFALSRIHLSSYPPVTLLGGVSPHDLNRKNESLAFVKSLTVYSIEWFVFQPEDFHGHCRAALHYLLLAPIHLFRYLRSAKDTPSLSKELASLQGQYYLKKLPECLPNLESVKWYIQADGPKTSRTLFLKVLVLLPSLKELDLSMKLNHIKDLDSFMYLLTQVSGLQRLTLRLRLGTSPCERYFRWFGRLIANNPNLEYLHLECQDATISLLRVFCHVPVDHPAQLKHLLLHTGAMTSELGMISHLRSLQSLNICWMPKIWETLALNGIFIPFLTVGFVCEELCKYLLLNASLVSFTIFRGIFLRSNRSHDVRSHLFSALETTNVAQITISPFNWAKWYESTEIEACLRRCAKLRRITLHFFENTCQPVDKDIRAAIKTVSRLGDKISLEISGDEYIHRAFSRCCESEDPLMKSLQHRLEFLEPQDFFP